jgi:hypothetical protein|tara:strand:+ start:84 stop:245 length:162 start_codon:yes stop_codon:yes gene_type:complete
MTKPKNPKDWVPAKEFRIIKLPREEPMSTAQLLKGYIKGVDKKEKKTNGKRKE